jgi:hypothetical protein
VDCIDMAPPRGEWSEKLRRAAGARGRRRKTRLEKEAYRSAAPEERRRILAAILKKP